jgi:hypothetical protein
MPKTLFTEPRRSLVIQTDKQVNNRRYIPELLILALLFCLIFRDVYSQTLVQDSLVIYMGPVKDMTEQSFSVDTVLDHRKVPGRLIGTYEVNKYLFIPVDLMIVTDRPLREKIAQGFSPSHEDEKIMGFRISIDDFRITQKTSSVFYPRYQMNGSFRLWHYKINGDAEYIGQLVYEKIAPKPLIGDELRKGFTSVVQKWQKDWVKDLSQISQDVGSGRSPAMRHFRSGSEIGKKTNMLPGADVIVGSRWWMVDGQIYFSDREAVSSFFRSGGQTLRYRNTPDYEAIEFNLSTDRWFYRLTPKLVFRIKSSLLFGINKWKDINDTPHEIWDAVLLDYSLSQSLFFNPLDKRSVTLGAGLLQSMTYIYSQSFRFHFGFLLHFGAKL